MVSRSHLRISMWFLGALALLVINAAYIYKNFKQFDTQKDLVNHTYEVINTLEEVVSLLKDVQSAQRGYVITGQMNYLTPYSAALPQIDTLMLQLDQLVADNPRQRENLDTLEGEVRQRLSTAANVVNAYQNDGQEKAFSLIREGTGNHEMDMIRAQAADMVRIEKDLLNLRQSHVDRFASWTLWLGGSGLLLCIGVLWLVFAFMQRDNRRREKAEATLQIANEEMRQTAERDAMVSQMTTYLHGCATTDEARDILDRFLPVLLPGSGGAIYTYDTGRQQLTPDITWGDNASFTAFTPEDCWAMRRGQIHIAGGASPEPPCAHATDTSGCRVCLPQQAHGGGEGLFFAHLREAEIMAHTTAFIRRISEQVSLALTNIRLQESLRHQSISDPLTGLYNRRHLEETMQRELSRTKRGGLDLAVLVMDIDHFKKYNDLRGQDAGDALLRQFAETLRLHTRREDIVCRYGGEEFVVILPGTALEAAEQYANTIRLATSSMQVVYNGQAFDGVTVSIGISGYGQHGETLDTLITAADAALYRAKQNGRNRVEIAQKTSH